MVKVTFLSSLHYTKMPILSYFNCKEEPIFYSPPNEDIQNHPSEFVDDIWLNQSRSSSQNSIFSTSDNTYDKCADDYYGLSASFNCENGFCPKTSNDYFSFAPMDGIESEKILTNLDQPDNSMFDADWPPLENGDAWQSSFSYVNEEAPANFNSEAFPEIDFDFDIDRDFSSVHSPSSGSESEASGVSGQNLFTHIKTEQHSPAQSNTTFSQNSPKTSKDAKLKAKSNKIRRRHGKQPTLWQFLYHALDHPTDYRHMISWVDLSKGIFEFSSKNKDDLARAWGVVKNNRCTMTYPKLARALRKYIEGEKFVSKYKRKLQYVFRPEFLQQLQSNVSLRQLSESDEKKMFEFSRAQRR